MLEALDTELGRLLAGIDPAVLAETIVFVVGDNGTAAQATTPPFDPIRITPRTRSSRVYNLLADPFETTNLLELGPLSGLAGSDGLRAVTF